MTATASACLAAAEEAQRAARAIVADPSCAPRSAAAPLVTSWRALLTAIAPERPVLEDIPAELLAPLSTREQQAVRAELPALLVAASLPAEQLADLPLDRPRLLVHCGRLARVLAATRARLGVVSSPVLSLWPRRLGLAAIATALALAFIRPWQSPTLGPWRGSYYSRHDFTGEVRVRHDLDLRFDWGRAPPFDEIPANRYAVRWDTCLHLEKPAVVTFQLTTDNSARLHVDGVQVVDNWGAKRLRARGGARRLAAGVHHLRVFYRKMQPESHVALQGSLDGEPPQALPFTALSAPGPDDEAPCR